MFSIRIKLPLGLLIEALETSQSIVESVLIILHILSGFQSKYFHLSNFLFNIMNNGSCKEKRNSLFHFTFFCQALVVLQFHLGLQKHLCPSLCQELS